MWISVALLLTLWGGILGTKEDLCNKFVYPVCYSPDQYPLNFPKTSEDLAKVCPVLKDSLLCVKSYGKQCGEESIESIDLGTGQLDKILGFLDDVCNEGSKLNKDIMKHLSCLEEVVENENSTCYKMSRRVMDLYERHIGANLVDDDYSYYNEEYSCLFHTLDATCWFALVETRCGDGARDVAIGIAERLGTLDRYCSSESRQQLLALIPALELEIEELTQLEQVLSGNNE